MSIQGELTVSLTHSENGTDCQIISSRPTQASRLFTGKTIEQTITTLPLLFSICAKAQTATTVSAIESALNTPASSIVESQREALVLLENLREQTFRILMDWPGHIDEAQDNKAFKHVFQGINSLMESLNPKQLLSYKAQEIIQTNSHQQLWRDFADQLSQIIFAQAAQHWLDNVESFSSWAEKGQSQPARFIHWLGQQDWKLTGTSSIGHVPDINDPTLVNRLENEQESFVHQPDWESHCYELSWFSRQHKHPLVARLNEQIGNGIYTRMLARLIEVAILIQKLESFFTGKTILKRIPVNVSGLAHTEAARGRLSHYVKLRDQTIEQLLILAPTEWNFHPYGVAADSLKHLQADSETRLQQQADLLIHAIDPCVGYQLKINGKERVVH